MKLFILLCLISGDLIANVMAPNFPSEGIISDDKAGFLDEKINYSRFVGRVSDRDKSGHVVKIQVENNNVKFFRAGDRVSFTIGDRVSKECTGTVKDVEDFHFVIYVNGLTPCANKDEEFLRKGTILKIISIDLLDRVYTASKFRELLLKKKSDLLRQLSGVNNFLWNFDQEKAKLASDYDKQIVDLQKEKERAMDDILVKKEEQNLLQAGLQRTLDEIDENLKYYSIERQELMTDRWSMDQDLGLPVGKRPVPQKVLESSN